MSVEIDKPSIKWYLKPAMVIVWIFVAGPFALPLVWISPGFKKWHKIVLTILLILMTMWMFHASVEIYRLFKIEMSQLKGAMQ
ncbi:MAG: hypothetical protein WC738_03200 [Candidatus Omnitrophota bacterium]|jgi:hypothetical protein